MSYDLPKSLITKTNAINDKVKFAQLRYTTWNWSIASITWLEISLHPSPLPDVDKGRASGNHEEYYAGTYSKHKSTGLPVPR